MKLFWIVFRITRDTVNHPTQGRYLISGDYNNKFIIVLLKP